MFKAFAARGDIFEGPPNQIAEYSQKHKHNEDFLNFWRCICICHDVLMIQDQKGKQHLSGASQDEISLLQTASNSDFAQFLSKDTDTVTIEIDGKIE